MHAAAGLLGHDAEQQRLGQARALVGRPHLVAHELVVVPGGQQLRPHPGQPLHHRRLDRVVELDDLGEVASVEDVGRAGAHRRDLEGDPAAAVGLRGGRVLGLRAASLQQPVVGRQDRGRVAVAARQAAAGQRPQRRGRRVDGFVSAGDLPARRLLQALPVALGRGVQLRLHVRRQRRARAGAGLGAGDGKQEHEQQQAGHGGSGRGVARASLAGVPDPGNPASTAAPRRG